MQSPYLRPPGGSLGGVGPLLPVPLTVVNRRLLSARPLGWQGAARNSCRSSSMYRG
jgi:hypothetical protein